MSEKLSLLPNLAASDGRETVGRLASESKAVGENVGRLMSGLDRRVRETLDPVLGQRRPLTVVGAAGLALALGGAVALIARRNRRPPGPLEKARRLRRAVARMIEEPDRVAQPAPGIGREVLGAAGTVVAATVAKKLIDRALSSRA